MTWHYQIVHVFNDHVSYYEIRERYEGLEDALGEEGPVYTVDAVSPYGETQEELIRDLERMLEDAKAYPVLEVEV